MALGDIGRGTCSIDDHHRNRQPCDEDRVKKGSTS